MNRCQNFSVDLENTFGIKALVAAFEYEEVSINDGNSKYYDHLRGGEQTWLPGARLPSQFLRELQYYLSNLAGWKHPDNKTTFIWEGRDGSFHAINVDAGGRHNFFSESSNRSERANYCWTGYFGWKSYSVAQEIGETIMKLGIA